MATRAEADEAHERLPPALPADAPLAPIVVKLDGYDDHGDAIDALALVGFLSGRQPVSRSITLYRVRPDARLLPEGSEPALVAESEGETVSLAQGPGWTLHVSRYPDRRASIRVTATDWALLDAVLAEATAGAVEPAPAAELSVDMGFWYLTNCGPRRHPRRISVAHWQQVRRNYGKRVAAALTRLMAIDPASLSGRLLLLHGPPGTGKTSALRSLAYEWRAWCQVDYVTDPERLLKDPGYLMAVATGHDEEDEGGKWRLILLEDCDELIRADAKPNAGQSLARLLNLTDGLLGQGLKVLVAITTNEPLAALHPAVVRPGRCIAQIEVGRLSRAEARAWLGRPAPFDAGGATLAELFALRGELTTVEERAPAAAGGGLYL